MSIYTEYNGKKRLPRSIYIKILIFIGLIGVSVIVMRPVQSALHAGIEHIRTGFVEKIEEITGLQVRYSSIRPAFFGSFDIRNLKLTKSENTFLIIPRIRISFSMRELLMRKKVVIGNIQIDRPSISLDLENDREILDLFLTLSNNGDENRSLSRIIADFFPAQAGLHIHNCSFNLSDSKYAYQIQNMDVDINANGGEFFFSGKLDIQAGYADFIDRFFIVKTKASVKGAYSVNPEEGNAEIAFSAINGAVNDIAGQLPANNSGGLKTLFDTRPLSFNLAYSNGIFGVRSLWENLPVNFSLDYNVKTGGVNSSMDCRSFPITDIAAFPDISGNIKNLLSIAVTGGASLVLENSGSIQYSVNFQGGNRQKSEDVFVIRAYGSEKFTVVDEFNFSASLKDAGVQAFHGNFGFSGSMEISSLTPEGMIYFDNFSLTGSEGVSAVFTVSSNNNEINISGEKVKIGQVFLNNLEILLLPSEIELGAFVSGVCEDEGIFNIETILSYRPEQLEVSLALNSFSGSSIAGMIHPFVRGINIPAAGMKYMRNSAINAEIFITTNFKQIVYYAPGILLSAGDVSGIFSFSGTDRQFTLTEGIFTRDEKDFNISAQVNFSNQMDIAFYVNASFLDLSWQVEGQILDRATLIISDPKGLHVYGSVSGSGAVSGYLECANFPILAGSRIIYLNSYLTLRYVSGDFWNLDAAYLEAKNPNGVEYLRVSGAANQDGASFRNLVYRDKSGELAGSIDFSWDKNLSYLQFVIGVTDGYEAGENYDIEGLLINERFDVHAKVSNMRLDRFLQESAAVYINGEAELSWDLANSINANINLTSLYAALWKDEIYASALISFSDDELAVSNLNINYAQIKAFMPVLRLSRTDGFAKASADIQGSVLGNKFESKIELDANFRQLESWADITQVFSSIDGSLNISNFRYGDTVQEPFGFVFARNSGSLSVSGGLKNMLRLDMDSGGNFFASLSSPLPIRSSVVGKYYDGLIDAYCGDFYLDLSALWALLPPVKGFNIAGGYITAKIDIHGPLLNPEFSGSGRGSSFCLQVPDYIREDIKPVPFNIVLEGNELVFNTVPATVGSGGGTINGWLRFENWIPKNLGMDIAVPKESPIPYSFNVTNFHANGDASGKISIILENSIMEINGDLFANNTEMGLSIEDRQAVSYNGVSFYPKISVIINFIITTGSVVEFIWPDTNMPILRANPEMGTVLTVSADTLNGQFTLNSDIMIRSGELYYFDRSFYIRSGNLVFRENELQFNPRLSARAEIRDRTDAGPVTISMIIENEPLLTFVPRFEASPVLTQLEIYSLLGQNLYGLTGGEGVDTAQRFILNSTTDILTQFVVNSEIFTQFIAVRRVERLIRNFLKFDMFSVRTRVLQNAMTNAIAELGLSPVDRISRVGNYFDNTTVFIGKYIGQDMFIQGMFSVKYDDNNPDFGGLRFEWDIGIELQSPLFNIRWDFIPYHPENWWVNDNSITLTWGKSF